MKKILIIMSLICAFQMTGNAQDIFVRIKKERSGQLVPQEGDKAGVKYTKQVNVDWPQTLHNVDNDELHSRLIKEIFGFDGKDINEAIKKYVSDLTPSDTNNYDSRNFVGLDLVENNKDYVEFDVKAEEDLGCGTASCTSYSDTYLIYDKNGKRFLNNSDIFIDPNSEDLLKIILQESAKIDELTETPTEVSQNFKVDKDGIIFIYMKYVLGPGYLGNVEIPVKYDSIKDLLTPEFKKLMGMEEVQ